MAGITLGNLPFEVGQCVEVKSFLAGFRGAWFRCKIKGFRRKKQHLGVDLEYIDFPDEKIKWTKLYQKHNRKRHLMIRPYFPPVYHDRRQHFVKTTNEVVVIVRDTWEVGDWVDWWASDCYWSGRLTEKLGLEKFQLELWPSPDGEGLTYEACSMDFRPSLNWSVEHGWNVPAPQDGGDFDLCARLILPMEGSDPKKKLVTAVRAVDKDKEAQTAAGAESHSSQDLMDSIPELPDGEHSSTLISSETRTLLDHETSLNVMHGGISDVSDDHPPKKMRSETKISIDPSTMESAIVDLEELVNRIRWIKSILKPSPYSEQLPWEFIDHTRPPTLK